MPRTPDLISLFDGLHDAAVQPTETHFAGRPIPGFERHRLARDASGAPVLLVSTADHPGCSRPGPVVLQHLSVQYDVHCRLLKADGDAEEGQFLIVRCTGGDQALHSHFLRVVGSAILELGAAPSRADVARTMGRLVDLFRAMSAPPVGSVQGLWAELLLIAYAADPVMLVGCWRSDPEDRYDFNSGNHRIEVKSASTRIRQHHFSLEQLTPPQGTQLLIASVFVERSGGGASLSDLAEKARRRLAGCPDLALKLDTEVAVTLGERWRQGLSESFDLELARSSLAFYDFEVVPVPCRTPPPAVRDVRFCSDLTEARPIGLDQMADSGGLFAAVMRDRRGAREN